MVTARALRSAPIDELRARIVEGFPVDPSALEGWAYRGTSLGMPSFVERLTWKTFQKTFYRHEPSQRLLGWNVRLEQDGLDAPSRPKTRHGAPVTEWNYEVCAPQGVAMPEGFDRGLVIDYSRAANPPGVVRIVKDPLVSLSPEHCDALLGVSYLVVAGRCIETPTYFTLEREHPISYVPPALHPVDPSVDPLRLSRVERAWATQLFAAIVATDGANGVPPFDAIDTREFWARFDSAPSPLVRAGLRPMLYTLSFMPAVRGFGAPFFRLSRDDQQRFLELASHDERYFVRQSLATLKMLACFAYFDDATVRTHFNTSAAAPEPTSTAAAQVQR